MSGGNKSLTRIPWERIHFRPPICYLPPIWEIVIAQEAREHVKEIVNMDPSPDPWAIRNHLTAKIELVNTLVKEKKIDAKLGANAINHYNAHMEELGFAR